MLGALREHVHLKRKAPLPACCRAAREVEGPNVERKSGRASMDKGDVDSKAELPEDLRKGSRQNSREKGEGTRGERGFLKGFRELVLIPIFAYKHPVSVRNVYEFQMGPFYL